MSETRITNLGEKIDLDLMERTAQSLGWKTYRNVTVMGKECELAIQNPNSYYEIGFYNKDNATQTVYDDWRDIAQKDLQTIMPRYKENLFLEKTYIAGFVLADRVETENEIIIRVTR